MVVKAVLNIAFTAGGITGMLGFVCICPVSYTHLDVYKRQGWILAYYQWENGKTFEMIDKEIPICKIRNMYNPYHEMDISSAILKLREMSQVSRAETYLKKLRKRAGISRCV